MIWIATLLACQQPAPAPTERGAAPDWDPPAPVLRRLTASQYKNTVADLFGDVVLTASLEPDESVEGLLSVGASTGSISALGVENYEALAFDIAEQVLAQDPSRALSCDLAEAGCARTSLEALGLKVWRRPLSADELDRLERVVDTATTTLGDATQGYGYGVAALLQSPNFLFRAELGEDDPDRPGGRRYTGYEMASRLSYFLWDTTPDDELLTAAAAGELVTDAGVLDQVHRLLGSQRSEAGVRTFFTEMLTLYELDSLDKDPTVYLHYSDDVGEAAREQTLLDLTSLVLDQDAPWPTALTATDTHIDRKLAAIYNVAAPSVDDFGVASLPQSGGRRGLLGQVAVLAQFSHPTATSPTLRGKFVREVLLCQTLLPPPGDVSTVLPEPTEDAATMRERLEQHREDPSCAACHGLTDPIGLGLENFDGLGVWRTTDHGATIDPADSLDGVPFADAWNLAGAVSEHDRLNPCLVQTLYRYAQGRVLEDADDPMIDWYVEGFDAADHSVLSALADLAGSAAFRQVGGVE